MTSSDYSFLPWYRRGIGGLVAGTPAAGVSRATVKVELKIDGEPIAGGSAKSAVAKRDIEIFGPGDIVGIDQRAIIRTDPRDWITNFEPNYLAQIEFYDEDFPWRYTPVGPLGGSLQLTPWITLIVLQEDEFNDGNNIEGKPLAFIALNSLENLPAFSELWAWAHVHVNDSLATPDAPPAAKEIVSTAVNLVLDRLDKLLTKNSDLAYSRIVCPRKLKPNQAYHAFLVPSFESGRRAGLGITQKGLPDGGKGAWETYPDRPDSMLMPVYHRWYFRTGESGDFEDLVRLLKPRTVDPKVGFRDMDVQSPGASLPGINVADLHGILKLGGALQAPFKQDQRAEREKFDKWHDRDANNFQVAIAKLINLADDYLLKPAPVAHQSAIELDLISISDDGEDPDVSPDPVVVPPLYGRWHAAVDRLLKKPDRSPVPNVGNWLHQLNLDPRYRVAASTGAQVIQKGQEDFMTSAWAQVGDVIAANRKLRWSQFARQVSRSWYNRRFMVAAQSDDRFLRLTRPAHGRVRKDGKTVRAEIEQSFITTSLLSRVASRMMRPRGRLIRLIAKGQPFDRNRFIQRLNADEVWTVSQKILPTDMLTLDFVGTKSISHAVDNGSISPRQADLAFAVGEFLIGEKVDFKKFDKLPKLEKLHISDPDSPEQEEPRGTPEEAARFIEAERGWLDLMNASEEASRRDDPQQIDIAGTKTTILFALEPLQAIRKRTMNLLDIPTRISDAMEEQLDEIMHHPIIDTPMYKPMEQISKEFLMPNLSLIPQNCITTVVTNQPFIESYMIGLNHEFARELLWREYPTDQRGSVFRQFWDVKNQIPPPSADLADFRESIRDIPKIHRWPRASTLGSHDNHEPPIAGQEKIVLVIRGELLKKYPNTVIYAQRAKWQETADGVFDPTKERELDDVSDAEFEKPPKEKLRFPIFEAKVDPDIYLFGFDLGTDTAKGRIAEPATKDNVGWFFVLKERPGEPRFGFDTANPDSIQTVNDIAWPSIVPSGSNRQFIDPATVMPTLEPLTFRDGEKKEQQPEDEALLSASISSARWAYILYQAPVMVAIHASEMLKQE
jgi:hypothetical protein